MNRKNKNKKYYHEFGNALRRLSSAKNIKQFDRAIRRLTGVKMEFDQDLLYGNIRAKCSEEINGVNLCKFREYRGFEEIKYIMEEELLSILKRGMFLEMI